MDIPRKFKRRANARPDEILDAALELFTKNGFAATRTEDIAAAAGITKATIYLYFPSKVTLLEGLVRRVVVPNIEAIKAAVGLSQDPVTVIAAMLDVMQHKLADPNVVAVPILVLREAAAFPELAQMYRREVIDQMRPILKGLIAKGIANGSFHQIDPEVALRSIVGPIIMNALLFHVFGLGESGGQRWAAFFDEHRKILARGLLIEPGAKL